MEDKLVSSELILLRTSLRSYFVSWKICLFTCKKIAFMSSTEMIIPFRLILRHEKRCILWNLLRSRHLMEKNRIFFAILMFFPKVFSTKSKKEDTIYMGIIYMSFLTRNLFVKIFTPCRRLCGVMNFSVCWNDDCNVVFFYLVFYHKSVTQKI